MPCGCMQQLVRRVENHIVRAIQKRCNCPDEHAVHAKRHHKQKRYEKIDDGFDDGTVLRFLKMPGVFDDALRGCTSV